MSDPGATRARARIALGRALRDHRRHAGMSGQEAASRLGWSQSKVSRIEAARVRTEVSDVAALLELYSVRGRERSDLLRVAESAAGPPTEWRNSTRAGLSRRQQDFVSFEAAASAITYYQTNIIPGPFQTRRYAERVLAMVQHPEPARALDTRMARQKALLSPAGPKLDVVLTDLAVQWNPGPDDLLADQLLSLAALAEEFDICLHVVPIHVAQPTFLAHPVVLYDFIDGTREALVETTTVDIRVTNASELDHLAYRVKALDSVALSVNESIAYLRQIAEQLNHGRTQ
jgi:transcriptional regulator with XRE-family HTH domain